MKAIIDDFFYQLKDNPIDLYGESGFQHDLAIFIKTNYPNLIVKLEYPTTRIYPNQKLIKKEMDIYIQDGYDRYLIELKMPKTNSGLPIELYHTVKDVKFGEQLISLGFKNCYSILLSNRTAAWKADRATGLIYKMFNGDSINISSILDLSDLPPFMQNKKGVEHIELNRIYSAPWKNILDDKNEMWQYYILPILQFEPIAEQSY